MSVVLIVLAFVVRQIPIAAEPAGNSVNHTIQNDTRSPNSYCGLHCVYAILKDHGISIEFNTLLNERYLEKAGHSSADNLCEALREFGLRAQYHKNVAVDRLLLLNEHVILHVRSPGAGQRYRHWILFLGVDGNRIKVYDPPRDIGYYAVDELLTIWDGAAVVVSNKETFSQNPKLTMMWVSPISVTCLLFAFAFLHLGKFTHANTFWRVSAACLLGLLFHTVTPWGFIHGDNGIAALQALHFRKDMKFISYESLKPMLSDPHVAIVDARPESAYNFEHIPGAINIPIGSGGIALNTYSSQILSGNHTRAVVYCQSESCPWAEAVGRQLAARGAGEVFVYSGGLNDWRSKTDHGKE